MAIEARLVSDPVATVYKLYTIVNQAYTVGDIVMLSPTAADVIPATSATTPSRLIGVAMSAQVSGDTTVLVALVNENQVWAVDVANTAVTTDNMQRMILTDATKVNNTHTDSTAAGAIFRQEGIAPGGVATRAVGRFLKTTST